MYISNAYSADFVNIIYNMLIGIASAIPIIFVLKDFLIENWKIFKDKFLENIIWVLTIGLVVSYGLAFVGTAIETLILGSQASDATNQVFVNRHLDYGSVTRYIESEFFTVDCYRMTGENTVVNDKPFQMVSIIEGEGTMNGESVKAGDHFVVCEDQDKCTYDGHMTVMITTL